MDGIEYIGLVASTLATFAFLPQVVKTWRSRSAEDFSLATLLMLEAGVGLWIIYGVWREAPAIWLGNGVTFLLAGYILTVKMRSAPSHGSLAKASKPYST
jgi:MtN3 and saliva related transmembrane protein